jgi:uncharacterized membrane protein YhaH (DUF805 family)
MGHKLKSALRFAGRAKRREYWMTLLLFWAGLTCLVVPTIFIPILVSGVSSAAITAVSAVVGLVALVASPYGLIAVLAASVRRLHDRDKTGWWVIPFVFVPGILDVIARKAPQDFALILALVALGLELWALFEIGLLSGTPGQNRFGPSALSSSGLDIWRQN